MKTDKLFILLSLGALAVACSGGGGNPSPPTLGRQIDRMGRAGVNTALTDPFDTVLGMTSDQVKDAYNASTDPTTWASTWSAKIAVNLAILDGLDGVCGNQLLAGGTATPGRYNALAGILADDELYVNTANGTCSIGGYLAVEANAAGVAGTATDCGGRTPVQNSIDRTYSVLVAGALSGVTNGVTVDVDGNANATTFPFLGSPN